VSCTVETTASAVVATLDVPARGVAPGQTLVVYDGDRVVGSATVAAAR
jgi:tRNA-specific 2-thiouridylase